MTREIYEKLHRAVDALPREERNLIHAIYFEGKSEREYARILGISQNSTLKRRRKILSKLKKFAGETTIFCDSPAIFSFYRGKLPKKQYFVTSTVLCQRNHKKYRLHPPRGLPPMESWCYDIKNITIWRIIQEMDTIIGLKKRNRRNTGIILTMLLAVVVLSIVCLFVGSSNMTVSECIAALRKTGSASHIRIIWNIRIPRVLAAIIAGAGLAVSGLIMQITLNNSMASPSTLGVSNAAVFGANLSIIAFAGGYLSTGNNLSNYAVGANPYATSVMAFVFSTVSILMILGLCTLRSFSPNVVVLAGMAIGSVWTAATTILQFYATDVGISAAVVWNFGDLGRATYRTDAIMLAVVIMGFLYFMLMAWRFNALLSGEATAKTMGIHVKALRFVSLEMAYNAYYTNYEIALINTWFVAKTVYPELFADIDLTAKTNEVTKAFLGQELAEQISACPSSFGGYQKIDTAAFFG